MLLMESEIVLLPARRGRLPSRGQKNDRWTMEKIFWLLVVAGLGGCALAPATVTTPGGKTVGIFPSQVVVTRYNPVVYPARPTAPAAANPAESSGRDARSQYPEYLFTE